MEDKLREMIRTLDLVSLKRKELYYAEKEHSSAVDQVLTEFRRRIIDDGTQHVVICGGRAFVIETPGETSRVHIRPAYMHTVKDAQE